MGKSQRTKGHNFERSTAKWFRSLYPDAQRRYQSRGGTSDGADVDGTPFFIECKIGQRPNIFAAMRQALEAKKVARDCRPALVITKRDREHVMATMKLADFLILLGGQLGKENCAIPEGSNKAEASPERGTGGGGEAGDQ